MIDSSHNEPDELYERAVAIVGESRSASIAGLQRRLGIGYNRTARLIEAMEAAGLVSPPDMSGKRTVLTQKESITQPTIPVVELVKVLPTKVWTEKDLMGTVHILVQHEGESKPFDFIQIGYDYRYTSNLHQHELTQKVLALIGAGGDAATSAGSKECPT